MKITYWIMQKGDVYRVRHDTKFRRMGNLKRSEWLKDSHGWTVESCMVSTIMYEIDKHYGLTTSELGWKPKCSIVKEL